MTNQDLCFKVAFTNKVTGKETVWPSDDGGGDALYSIGFAQSMCERLNIAQSPIGRWEPRAV